MKNTDETVEAENLDSGVLSNPVLFIHSGFYNCYNAALNSRGTNGYYQSLTSYNTAASSNLYFRSTDLYSQNFNDRGFGFAVRCVANPSPLSLILAIL